MKRILDTSNEFIEGFEGNNIVALQSGTDCFEQKIILLCIVDPIIETVWQINSQDCGILP